MAHGSTCWVLAFWLYTTSVCLGSPLHDLVKFVIRIAANLQSTHFTIRITEFLELFEKIFSEYSLDNWLTWSLVTIIPASDHSTAPPKLAFKANKKSNGRHTRKDGFLIFCSRRSSLTQEAFLLGNKLFFSTSVSCWLTKCTVLEIIPKNWASIFVVLKV